MPEIIFGKLPDDDFDAAIAILVEVTQWLLSKGIRQWLSPMPAEIYRKRQEAGENYALHVDGELAAVVSLMDYRPQYWAEYLPETPFTWLGTLAVARRFAGQNLGDVTVKRAVEYIQQGLKPGESTFIYIDCLYGSGFLPDYYTRLGFETITRKLFKSSAQDYDGVLMRLPARKGSLPVEIHIRQALVEDAAAIASITRERDTQIPINEPVETTIEKIVRNIALCHADNSHRVVVAEIDGAVQGYAAVHFLPYLIFDGPDGYVSELFILSSARNRGIGTKLLETIEQEARARGCVRLSLLNSKTGESYRRDFYKKHGWEEREHYANFIRRLD